MVVIELTDPSGKLECALFGEYVGMLRNFLNGGGNIQVVVVVQLARVKCFKGKNVIQNNMNATRLLFNPGTEEAIVFRNSIAEHGSIAVEPLAVVLDSSREGLEADFMKNNPKKTIAQLTSINEDEMFIVLGEIVDVVTHASWFYLACKCNRSVSLQSGVYFCKTCGIPVLQVHPRYKVKVEVADQTGTAVMILFDRDVTKLLQKTCEDLLGHHFEGANGIGYPDLINSLIGRKLLFKVETTLEQAFQYDGTCPVRKVCYDEVIISMFELMGANNTPTKAVFAPPFSKVDTNVKDLEEQHSQADCEVIGTSISLGDTRTGLPTHWTPPSGWTYAKRKLDVDFVACQDDCSVSGVKSKKNGMEDIESLEFDHVPLKLEND